MASSTEATQPQAQDAKPTSQDDASVAKIQLLLKAKDDTQRFVGLALLKSVLDNSPELRGDEQGVLKLWDSLSAKFLDRLLRTGAKASRKDAREMLDLAVSILHTFAVLLPEQERGKAKFTERIPGLVDALLYSREETTELLLQLLYTLVSSHEGALALVRVEDISSLTEIAPTHAIVMDILSYSWLNCMAAPGSSATLTKVIDTTVQSLVSSFRGTDAVTLLAFLGNFLRRANAEIIPPNPAWLASTVAFIQNLVKSRPTPEARSAYTDAASALLQAYPPQASALLFRAEKGEEKSFSYLFINLLLIDIRSSAPLLLEQLNSPDYPKISRRLASAFDVICIFIGYLVRSLDDDSFDGLVMPPDDLLKLRKGVSETMSVTIEYVRDRWDATFAGAMGLHPDARTSAAETSMGSRHTLAWDSLENVADEDPFILSAVRALALWLREDENEMLRKEATGLTDMLVELYRGSSPEKLDFRSPVILALEALVTFEKGRNLLLQHEGWKILSKDLVAILQRSSKAISEPDAMRGVEIIRVLIQIAEQSSSTADEWMDVVTAAAALDVPDLQGSSKTVLELRVAALQLCCALLANATLGLRGRYRHSTSALVGVAMQLDRDLPGESELREDVEDILGTLRAVSIYHE